MELFFQPGPASHSYEAIRDRDHLTDTKAVIEQIWSIYAPYADPGFLEDVKTHFHQRTWEMYVWFVFEHHGFAPQKISSAGPEFFVMIGSHRFWIEAIAPEKGDAEDAVPLPSIGKVQLVPETKILLRYTNALQKKLNAYTKSRESGRISQEDGYIIAINGWEATGYRPDSKPPLAIKAVFGIGDLVVSVDTTQQTPSQWYHQPRDHVSKKSASPVPTTAFLSMEYEVVSALFYSDIDIGNVVNVPRPLGSEMYYCHNPTAKTLLPRGVFRFCREYWFVREEGEGGKLYRKDWRTEGVG
jgi:hypothetical protein